MAEVHRPRLLGLRARARVILSDPKSSKKKGHLWGVALSAAILIGSSAAAFYVAYLHKGPGLPSWLYRLAPDRAAPEGPARALPSVRWRSWRDGLLEARREEKLVLLVLSAGWSHACRLMEETTFASSELAGWVESHWVPVRVDIEERPDLAVQYGSGGWPTTAALLPSGEILSSGTYMTPESFRRWAGQVEGSYRGGKAGIEERAAKARRDARAERAGRAARPAPGPEKLRASALEALQGVLARHDARYGGFGGPPKFPMSEPVRFLLAAAALGLETPRALEAVGRTLEAQSRLQDPVWGGFYRYAGAADWSEPRHEKLLEVQARLIEDYLAGWAATGDDKHRRAAERALEYVSSFLESPGGFQSSQSADVYDGHRFVLSGDAYYAMSQEARQRVPPPRADRRRLAAPNAEMAAAYLIAGRDLGRPDLTAKALGTADSFLEAIDRNGAMRREPGARASAFLDDQTAWARAYALAYAATGRRRYLDASERLLNHAMRHLAGEGGLRAGPAEPGAVEPPLHPAGTLRAAELWLDLYNLTGDKRFLPPHQRLWRWCAANPDLFEPAAWGRLALKTPSPP